MFLMEFATKVEASGPAGYLQSMAHRHGEVPLNDPAFDEASETTETGE